MFVQWSRIVCAISVKSIKETFVCNYFEFGPVDRKEMLFLTFFGFFFFFFKFLALVAILFIKSKTICTILNI